MQVSGMLMESVSGVEIGARACTNLECFKTPVRYLETSGDAIDSMCTCLAPAGLGASLISLASGRGVGNGGGNLLLQHTDWKYTYGPPSYGACSLLGHDCGGRGGGVDGCWIRLCAGGEPSLVAFFYSGESES